jgi:hypothetical protein
LILGLNAGLMLELNRARAGGKGMGILQNYLQRAMGIAENEWNTWLKPLLPGR